MRKISKQDVFYLVTITLTWLFINFAGNLIGLWITKMINEAEYQYPDSIWFEFVIPGLVQTLVFGLLFTAAFYFLKKKRFAPYAFTAFQFVAFNLFFIINLKINHGLHFVSTFKNIGVRYMSYFGQSMVDILPITGTFNQSVFAPDKTGIFYIYWVLLNIGCYVGITWLSIITAKYFLGISFAEQTGKSKVVEKEEGDL